MAVHSAERKQFVFDVFTTALEGGISYWAKVDEYHWRDSSGNEDLEGFRAAIRDAEDPGDQLSVDATVIDRGISLFDPIASERPAGHYWRQFLDANRTNGADGDYDAGVADAIVQLGLFGKIIYG